MGFRSFACWALFLLVATTGCGDRVKVTGRVTFEDGTPLTLGQIIFTDDFYMGRSDLDKNGEYQIHTLRRNDGIRKGVYRVYITGAIRFDSDEGTEFRESDLYTGRAPEIKPVYLIDNQYTNPDTTGWVFDLKKNSKLDFVVYPPGEVPEGKRTEMAKLTFDRDYWEKVQAERAKEAGEIPETTKPRKKRTVNPKLL